MNSKFKALIKATGNNHLTNYILTSYNEPQTLFHERPAASSCDESRRGKRETSDERRATRDKKRATINMQNKPNLPDAQMNVTSTITKHYKNARLLGREKNKPKTNPTCRGAASGEAGSKPISNGVTKNSSIRTYRCPQASEGFTFFYSVVRRHLPQRSIGYCRKLIFKPKAAPIHRSYVFAIVKSNLHNIPSFPEFSHPAHKSNILPGFRILFGSSAVLILRSISR